MPPGVTGDDYSTLAITGHYMRLALDAINYTEGQDTVDAVALSPDGNYVAIGGCIQPAMSQCPNDVLGGYPFLVILGANTGEVIAKLPEKNTTITALAFTQDSRKLIYILIPFEIKVWDIAAGKLERTMFKEEGSRSYAKMQLSPDGTQLAVVTRDNLLVLDFATGEKIIDVPARRLGSVLPLYSANGSRLLVYKTSEPPVLAVYDTANWKVVTTIPIPNTSSIAFSPDGKRVLTVEKATPVKLLVWDADTGKQVDRLEETYEYIYGIAIAPDTGLLYVSGYGGPDDLGGLSVWDLIKRERMGVLFDYDPSDTIKFTPDGRYLLSNSFTQVWMWGPINGQIIADRKLVMDFYDSLSRGDYEAAAEIFQPGEFEIVDYQSPDAGADLAAQLKLSCKLGKLICQPLLRILPGGGMTNLGDDIVYFQFQSEDGSVFKDPSGFSNLYTFVGKDKDGKLKISYPPRIE